MERSGTVSEKAPAVARTGPGQRSVTIRTALLVGTLMLGVLLAGCTDGDGAVSATDRSESPSATIEEAERLYDEISQGIKGTQAQTDAVSYLEGHVAFQGLIIECMADQGFTYIAEPGFRVPSPISRFAGHILDPVDAESLEADALGLDAALAGLAEQARAGNPIDRRATGEAPARPEHEVEGWQAAVGGCVPTSEELDAWVDHPPYDEDLGFEALVYGVLEGEPVARAAAGYADCVDGAGWDAHDHYALVRQVLRPFETLMIEALEDVSPEERAAEVDRVVASAEWSELDQQRADAAAADADCRREAHTLAFTALRQPLEDFQEEHRAGIEERRAAWADVEERAAQAVDPAG